MQIITVDFETFYSKEYTLTGKQSMSEYIRDARFHVHCVGIKVGEQPTQTYRGEDIATALQALDWKNSSLLCHNTQFDGLILSHHYGIVPKYYLDTMCMAKGCHSHHLRMGLDALAKFYGLGAKLPGALVATKGLLELDAQTQATLEQYCAKDVDLTHELFWKLYQHTSMNEMDLIDITLRMFCDPILLIDIPRAQAEYEREVSGKFAAVLLANVTAPDLLSNDKFAELLRKAGYQPPTKISPTTKRSTYAFAKTDDGFRALLDSDNTAVRQLAQARLKVKSTIGETRALRMIEAGRDGMRLPVALNYCGAHTRRWSGGNKMNLQNLQRGGELRKSILAPEGYSIVVCDSAQIEARVTAWLADHHELLNAFREKRDVYSEFASVAFGRKVDRKRKAPDGSFPDFIPGFVGKTCVLGLGFGMGPAKLQATLKIGLGGTRVDMSLEECHNLVNTYRSVNKPIADFWKVMDDVLSDMAQGGTRSLKGLSFGPGYVDLPDGCRLHYYGMSGDEEIQIVGYEEVTGPGSGMFKTTRKPKKKKVVRNITYATSTGPSSLYGGLFTENLVQALARAIVAEHMRIISKKYRIVTMTHDEIVCIAPENEAQQCLDFMLQTMSTPPKWAPELPLAAEGGYDKCYSK